MIDVEKLLANYAAKFPDGMIRDQRSYVDGYPATLGNTGAVIDGDATLTEEEL